MQDSHPSRRMADRIAGTRIDGVRVAHSIVVEKTAVIAGGGNSHAMQGSNRLRSVIYTDRGFQCDPPWLPVRLDAEAVKLAANFYQEIPDAAVLQAARYQVNAIPFSDTGKIHV